MSWNTISWRNLGKSVKWALLYRSRFIGSQFVTSEMIEAKHKNPWIALRWSWMSEYKSFRKIVSGFTLSTWKECLKIIWVGCDERFSAFTVLTHILIIIRKLYVLILASPGRALRRFLPNYTVICRVLCLRWRIRTICHILLNHGNKTGPTSKYGNINLGRSRICLNG